MNGALGVFQRDFVQAIYGNGELSPQLAALTSQPGFAVYRNTIIKGCIDALQANYPTIERLVGSAWLRDAAAIYVRAAPPTAVSLFDYGFSFPDFLARFEPAHDLPYLADVARLDRLWMEVHTAADDTPLDPAALAVLPPPELGRLILRPADSTRWIWFDTQPAYTIWRINREQQPMDDELAWRGEGGLLTRRDGAVCWQPASAACCTFLDACAAGLTLEQAMQAAQQVDAALDIGSMLASLVAAGAFAAVAGANPSP